MNAPATPAGSPGPAAPTGRVLRDFARRGARNLLVCLAIAVLLWSFAPDEPDGFRVNLIYSTAIGTLCWFFIDGSRLLLSHGFDRFNPSANTHGKRWPGPVWMVVCVLVGVLLGYHFGAVIGNALTGHHLPSLAQNRGAVLISLFAAAAATYYWYARERLHEEQAAAEAARRLATESQLRLLESQLEPHMLFNTLANLRALIGIDPAQAQAMLDRLIAFLRATLQASRTGTHSLSAEFDCLADYLALMAVRMGPRLEVRLDLPAPLREQAVPALLLQPLVENAIRHGLEPHLGGGRLEVSARAEGGELVLVVRDTGAGLGGGGVGGGSRYGLQHVRERLAALYGARGRFELAPAGDAQGGVRAEVRLPLAPDSPPGGSVS